MKNTFDRQSNKYKILELTSKRELCYEVSLYRLSLQLSFLFYNFAESWKGT